MFDLVKTFKDENGLAITPIMMGDDPIFLTQEIGPQFGYKNLADSIRKSGGYREGIDFEILTGCKLQQLKDLLRRSKFAWQIPEMARSLLVVRESGIYGLAFRSQKDDLVKLRILVTNEVLPTIRKTGSYSVAKVKEDLIVKKIKERYLLDYFSDWEKCFSNWYYEAVYKMFDLGEHYPGKPSPNCVGAFTRDYIYMQMPPGIYEEIVKKNPERKVKHHQYLSKDARKHLKSQIKETVCLIKAANYDKELFKVLFKNAFPDNRYAKLLEEREKNLELELCGQITFDFMEEFIAN